MKICDAIQLRVRIRYEKITIHEFCASTRQKKNSLHKLGYNTPLSF